MITYYWERVNPDGYFLDNSEPIQFYTLSLHDALPIFSLSRQMAAVDASRTTPTTVRGCDHCCAVSDARSEEHTSELQSRENLVCRLLLEKKKILTFIDCTTTCQYHNSYLMSRKCCNYR